jgi:hypothetical protein
MSFKKRTIKMKFCVLNNPLKYFCEFCKLNVENNQERIKREKRIRYEKNETKNFVKIT